MAREAPNTMAAILAIARRLQRCRGLSLYRLGNGSPGWGRAHDAVAGSADPDEVLRRLDVHLLKCGEQLAVRNAVQRSGRLVAIASGSSPGRGERPVDTRNLLIRDGVTLQRRQKRRARNRALLALASLSAGGILAATGMKMAVIAGCTIFLLSLPVALSALASRRALRRLERLEILSAIEGPYSDRRGRIDNL